MDSKVDIWGLGKLSRCDIGKNHVLIVIRQHRIGLILHKLLFYKLPYADTENYDELAQQIKSYPG